MKKIYQDLDDVETRSKQLEALGKTYQELSDILLDKTREIVEMLHLRAYDEDVPRDEEIDDYNIYLISLGKDHFCKLINMSNDVLYKYVMGNKRTYKQYDDDWETDFMRSAWEGFNLLNSIRVLNQIW